MEQRCFAMVQKHIGSQAGPRLGLVCEHGQHVRCRDGINTDDEAEFATMEEVAEVGVTEEQADAANGCEREHGDAAI